MIEALLLPGLDDDAPAIPDLDGQVVVVQQGKGHDSFEMGIHGPLDHPALRRELPPKRYNVR